MWINKHSGKGTKAACFKSSPGIPVWNVWWPTAKWSKYDSKIDMKVSALKWSKLGIYTLQTNKRMLLHSIAKMVYWAVDRSYIVFLPSSDFKKGASFPHKTLEISLLSACQWKHKKTGCFKLENYCWKKKACCVLDRYDHIDHMTQGDRCKRCRQAGRSGWWLIMRLATYRTARYSAV